MLNCETFRGLYYYHEVPVELGWLNGEMNGQILYSHALPPEHPGEREANEAIIQIWSSSAIQDFPDLIWADLDQMYDIPSSVHTKISSSLMPADPLLP